MLSMLHMKLGRLASIKPEHSQFIVLPKDPKNLGLCSSITKNVSGIDSILITQITEPTTEKILGLLYEKIKIKIII